MKSRHLELFQSPLRNKIAKIYIETPTKPKDDVDAKQTKAKPNKTKQKQNKNIYKKHDNWMNI